MIDTTPFENAILCLLMYDPRSLVELEASGVTDAHFSSPVSRALYGAIRSLGDKSGDTMLLVDRLKERGEFDLVGGYAGVARYVDSSPDIGNIRTYIGKVKDGLARRRLDSLRPMIEAAMTRADFGTALSEIEDELHGIRGADTTSITTLQSAVQDAIDHIRGNEKRGRPAVSCGLPELDKYLGGLEPGDYVCLAARPGVGKTMLAAQVALSVSRDKPVFFFSAEMTARQLAIRYLASQAGLNAREIRVGSITSDDWKQIEEAQLALALADLHIDDGNTAETSEIEAKARLLRDRSPNGLGLVIVDYLQRLQGRPGEKEYDRVSRHSAALKDAAKSLGCPVLVLSQFNREGARAARPALHDLRSSGQIEQDADSVLIMHRPWRDGVPHSVTEVTIAKNRHGEVGRLPLATQLEFQRFSSIPQHQWRSALAELDS